MGRLKVSPCLSLNCFPNSIQVRPMIIVVYRERNLLTRVDSPTGFSLYRCNDMDERKSSLIIFFTSIQLVNASAV